MAKITCFRQHLDSLAPCGTARAEIGLTGTKLGCGEVRREWDWGVPDLRRNQVASAGNQPDLHRNRRSQVVQGDSWLDLWGEPSPTRCIPLPPRQQPEPAQQEFVVDKPLGRKQMLTRTDLLALQTARACVFIQCHVSCLWPPCRVDAAHAPSCFHIGKEIETQGAWSTAQQMRACVPCTPWRVCTW